MMVLRLVVMMVSNFTVATSKYENCDEENFGDEQPGIILVTQVVVVTVVIILNF